MSNTALTHVWNNSKAKGSALLVMIAIADMANDDGDCWPGRTNLAKKCRMTKRYLQKLTAQLVELGELEILANEGVETSHGKTNRYKVTGVINRSSLDTDGVSYSSPHTDNGVNRSSSQGVNYDSPKPSIEPSVKEQPSEKIIAAEPQPPTADDDPKPKRLPNLQQLLFEAICKLFTYDMDKLTPTEKKKIGQIASELRQGGCQPEQVKPFWEWIQALAIKEKWRSQPSMHTMKTKWSDYAQTLKPVKVLHVPVPQWRIDAGLEPGLDKTG